MKPIDIVIVLVVVAIAGLAAFYIYRSKKKGRKCIGCPHADSCSHHCQGKH